MGYIIPVTVLKRVLEDFFDAAGAMGIQCHPFPFDSESDDEDDGSANSPSTAAAAAAAVVKWPETAVGMAAVKLRGFARFDLGFQTAESPYVRKSVNLTKKNGVIIRSIPRLSNLHGLVLEDDVLLEIDAQRISNGGHVNQPHLPPMAFQVLLSSKLVGEEVTYTVLRQGRKVEIVTIAENPPRWVPIVEDKLFISYVMFAGLVFTPTVPDSEDSEKRHVRHKCGCGCVVPSDVPHVPTLLVAIRMCVFHGPAY